MNKWISVNESLPIIESGKNYSKNVLAWLNNRLEVMCRFQFLMEDEYYTVWANCYGDIYGDGEYDDDYLPTHWMPLPDQPK